MSGFGKNIITGLLLAVVLIGCSGKESASEHVPGLSDSASMPDTEVRGAKIYLYERGTVTAEIISERIVKFEANDSTVAYKLDIDLLDSLGRVSTEIVGDSGIIRETAGLLYIYGNVVVIAEDESKLETDYLWWNSKTSRIKTDAFVKITREEDVISGWGLEADDRLDTIRILDQVSGTIRDAGKVSGE